MCGGGLVATATMAEAGFFADFMAWVKRRPVWSFPTKPKVLGGYAEFTHTVDFEKLATIYYDKVAIDNLKANLSFVELCKPRDLPAAIKEKSIQMFQYALNPAGID